MWRTNVPTEAGRVAEPLASHDVPLPEIDSPTAGQNDHRTHSKLQCATEFC